MEDNLTAIRIKEQAIKSVKWTALGEVVTYAIQPITTLILARLLTPKEFGVVGIALIFIGLAQIFQDFGLGKALIQRENDLEKCANVIFITNIVLSVLTYTLLFLCSPLISAFFHNVQVKVVLRVLCLQLILNGLSSVHQSLLQRRFQFRLIFFIRVVSAAISAFVAIPLALRGLGVWALVSASLASALAQLLLLWFTSQWRPRLTFDAALAKHLYNFGGWVTLEALLGWFILWGDSIVLGHFLGARELGVYRVGISLLMLLFGIFLGPLVPVAYSAFSRLQAYPDIMRQFFLKSTGIMAVISIPLGVSLVILCKPISSVFFGKNWGGIEYVIAFLGIKDSLGWLFALNSEVYRGMGRPDVSVKLHTLHLLFIPIYVVAAQYGLLAFCIARSLTILVIPFHIYILGRLLHLSATYFWDCIRSALLGSLIMVGMVYSLRWTFGFLETYNIINFLFTTVFMISTYFLALSFLDRELIARAIGLIRQSFATDKNNSEGDDPKRSLP